MIAAIDTKHHSKNVIDRPTNYFIITIPLSDEQQQRH